MASSEPAPAVDLWAGPIDESAGLPGVVCDLSPPAPDDIETSISKVVPGQAGLQRVSPANVDQPARQRMTVGGIEVGGLLSVRTARLDGRSLSGAASVVEEDDEPTDPSMAPDEEVTEVETDVSPPSLPSA